MAKNEFGDEIVEGPTNEFGDPIESSVATLPAREPLPPEQAFDLAGKQWDAAIDNDVPLITAQQWFYDAELAASDPDDFADPVPDNRTGFSDNFMREWTEKRITKLPITGGVAGTAEAIGTILAANRLSDPEFDYDALNRQHDSVARSAGLPFIGITPVVSPSVLTRETDRKIIAQAFKDLEFQSRGKTFGGKVAVGVSQLPTWMIEFAATGGLASLGDDAARIAGQKLLGRYAKTTVGKVAIKSAGLVTGAVVRTSTGLLPRVSEKAAERQALIAIGVAGEEGWATSLAKAWGGVAIESLTEETGGLITKGLTAGLNKLPFGKKFMAGLQKDWTAITGGTADNFATRMLAKGGYSTIIGEVGEERLATLLREATGVSDRRGNPFQRMWEGMKEDFEPENLGAEIVTLLAPASVRRGMTMGVSLTEGVSVPSESEQLEAAIGVGPIRFDTPLDAQGYADKVKTVADREDTEITVTVDENVVTVEEKVEEVEEPKPSIAEQRRAEVERQLRAGEEVPQRLRDEFADLVTEIEKPVEVTGEAVAEAPAELVGQNERQNSVTASKNFEELTEGKDAEDVDTKAVFAETKTFQDAVFAEIEAVADNAQLELETFVSRASTGTEYITVQTEDGEIVLDELRVSDHGVKGGPTDLSSVIIGTDTWQERLTSAIADMNKEINEIVPPAAIPVTEEIPEVPEVPKAKRVISQEGFDAARKRFRDSSKLRTGLDPQQLKDAAIIGGFLVESGVRKFGAWSKRMVSELGESIRPHLQDIWNGIKVDKAKAAPKPKKKVAKKKKVKKPEFPKDQSVTKAEQEILGEDPLDTILATLKKAKAVQPKTRREQRQERRRRVGAAAGALKSNVKRGTPTEESIFKSTGLLAGPLTEYTQVFESIDEQLTPEAKEAAYSKINTHPGLQYFEILNTATSFKKLLAGTALTPGDVKNIENVFGKQFVDITAIRLGVSDLFERLITLWKAGLLTGIKTQGLNILSNAAHAMSETASDIPASLVDSTLALFTGERSLAFTIKGYRAGVEEGLRRGWKHLRTGYDERNIGRKLDHKDVFFGRSKFAKALQAYEEFVFHLLGAADQPSYYGAKARSLASQAIAQAINQKLKGAERDDFVENLIKNPTDDMLEAAVHDAEVSVFTNRTLLGDIAKSIQKTKVGEVIVPFGRTPSAVATQIINYLPVIGPVKELFAQIQEGEFNQRNFSKAFGRSVVGTGVLFTGTLLLKAGLMTLDRPRDERERKLWELEGRKANSIKIGGKWRSAQVLGPAGNVLLIGGHFQDQLEKEGSPTKAIVNAMAGSAKSFSEQTFVRGVNQAVSALTDPERSFEFWFSSMAGSVVPTIVADTARAISTGEPRTEGPFQRIQSRIPVLRNELPPRIDVFGQDLPRYGGNPLEVMIDPTRPAKIKNDIVVDELRRLAENDIKVTPTLLGDRSGFDILTVEENSALWRRSGDLTYKVLLTWIGSEGYNAIGNDFTKGQTIEALTRKTKAAAKAEMVGIKLGQGMSLIKLAESGLLSIEGLDALQFFTK